MKKLHWTDFEFDRTCFLFVTIRTQHCISVCTYVLIKMQNSTAYSCAHVPEITAKYLELHGYLVLLRNLWFTNAKNCTTFTPAIVEGAGNGYPGLTLYYRSFCKARQSLSFFSLPFLPVRPCLPCPSLSFLSLSSCPLHPALSSPLPSGPQLNLVQKSWRAL